MARPRARTVVRWAGLFFLAMGLLPTWQIVSADGERRWTLRLGVPCSPVLRVSLLRTDRREERPGGGFLLDRSMRNEASLHFFSGSTALLLVAAGLGLLLRRLPRPEPPRAPSP